jgi:hypothetical protein
MRSTLEIEGIWEEILTKANEFSGKRVRLTLFKKGTSKESDLLNEINLGVSADTGSEYHTLIKAIESNQSSLINTIELDKCNHLLI